ncbi:hypothetical protein [Amycolatopsis sp. cmx-4-68]|uniref:hypothetical protein n=1 Tax=Amycolatopsis sp. cmx-4-68 TaxID=2790938 RepID=UPI00397B51FA
MPPEPPAMMLSDDATSVRDVLSQIHLYDIPIGRSVLDADDPFRNAVGRMMSEADDFDLHEMRLAWLSGAISRSRESELNRLRFSRRNARRRRRCVEPRKNALADGPPGLIV